MVEIICTQCGKKVLKDKLTRKFCSHRCYSDSKIGKPNLHALGSKRPDMKGNKFREGISPWNKGLVGFMEGEKNGMWKGEKAGYSPLHTWLNRNFGYPDHCDLCGRTEPPELSTIGNPLSGKKNYFQWSNKDHSYTRDLSKWWQLCTKCHRNYDLEWLHVNTKHIKYA